MATGAFRPLSLGGDGSLSRSPRHVTAQFAGVYLAAMGVDRPPSIDVIRQWRHRGHVRRVGTDEHGLALYDLNDILATVKRLGYPISNTEGEPPCA